MSAEAMAPLGSRDAADSRIRIGCICAYCLSKYSVKLG